MPAILREDLEKLSHDFHLKFLLAAMNSSFARRFLAGQRTGSLDIHPNAWKALPIASIPLADQQPLVDLVDKILAEYAAHGHPLPAGAAARVAKWEQEIDAKVYEIYGITPEDVESIAAAPTNVGDEDADDDDDE